MIARQWPVLAVIGENGGFYFQLKDNIMQRIFLTPPDQDEDKMRFLEAEILKEVPGAKLASDQFCRILDLAIDFNEEVHLGFEKAEQIKAIFEKYGAQAKISSIHVNGWFGTHNKLSGCKVFMQKELGLELANSQEKVAFIGDSPNDEPLFKGFENSFGVANISETAAQLTHKPTYITEKPHGLGFAELAEKLIKNQVN